MVEARNSEKRKAGREIAGLNFSDIFNKTNQLIFIHKKIIKKHEVKYIYTIKKPQSRQAWPSCWIA